MRVLSSVLELLFIAFLLTLGVTVARHTITGAVIGILCVAVSLKMLLNRISQEQRYSRR